MKVKTNLVLSLAAAAVIASAFSFVSCEQSSGPSGPAVYSAKVVYNPNFQSDSASVKESFLFNEGDDFSVTLKENSFEREGYFFAGWSTTPSGDDAVIYNPGQTYVFDFGFKRSVTLELYAVWYSSGNYIKITYDANDGSENPERKVSVKKKYGLGVNLDKNSFEREGYGFKGWALEKDSGNALYKDGGYVTFSEDTVLYALWYDLSVVKIIYHANDETISPSEFCEEVPVASDGKYYLNSVETFGKIEGKYIDYFMTSSNGYEIYNDCAERSLETLTSNLNVIEVYAHWKEGKEFIKVSLDMNDGSEDSIFHVEEINVKKLTIDQDFSEFIPEREGFYFNGISYNKDDLKNSKMDGIIDTRKLVDDTTVYLLWHSMDSVTYVFSGYSDDDIVIEKNKGESVTIPMDRMTPPAGRVFVGWSNSGDYYTYREIMTGNSSYIYYDDYLEEHHNVVYLTPQFVDEEDALKITYHNNIPGEEDETVVWYHKLIYEGISGPKDIPYLVNIFEREGYRLYGWVFDADDEDENPKTIYYGRDVVASHEVDVYAFWKE